MAERVFQTRRERALWRAARVRRWLRWALVVLLLGAGGLVAAWHLGLPWAPVAVFWALAGGGACAAAFLVWFVVALFVDVALCPRGRRGAALRSASREG